MARSSTNADDNGARMTGWLLCRLDSGMFSDEVAVTFSIGLFPGAYICQLIVETVKGVPFRNDSQFQGQHDAGGRI